MRILFLSGTDLFMVHRNGTWPHFQNVLWCSEFCILVASLVYSVCLNEVKNLSVAKEATHSHQVITVRY